ncbi:unnamed protein product [Effrenium voratum]|uniref:Gfo/Idh/MocA-like oxidoreductase N-terminal domain-containing protein n=1 Tax=Effrenium voratum TaxID=2562239 RepID=A0AA36IY32_9DINO|nr:unnamed protein product [Effrenium voratum]CAJ1438832.1 unnamed protein product [Effrenium voratum]
MLRLVHFLSLAVGLGAPCGPRDLDCWTQHVEAQLSRPCGRPVRLALVGAGSFARKAHLPSLRDASDCFAVGVVWSHTEVSARRLAADVPPAKALWGEEGWRALLSEDLELLDLVLPFGVQSSFVREALKAGFAVVSEKPIATTVAEAEELLSHGGRWYVAENWRFEPAFRVAAAAVHAGVLGEAGAVAFSAHSVSFMPPDVPYMQPGSWRMSETSNWMADVGVHFAAALRLVLGEDLRLVAAATQRLRPELRPFDTFAATLRTNASVGQWLFSLSLPKPGPKTVPGLSDLDLQISGPLGTLLVSRGSVQLLEASDARSVAKVENFSSRSVESALRAAARGVLGEDQAELAPHLALADLQLVEAIGFFEQPPSKLEL